VQVAKQRRTKGAGRPRGSTNSYHQTSRGQPAFDGSVRAQKRLRGSNLTGSMPACFENAIAWEVYKRHAVLGPPGENSYCRDCTPEYQIKMVCEGRCEHPCVAFKRSDGEWRGFRKEPTRARGPRNPKETASV